MRTVFTEIGTFARTSSVNYWYTIGSAGILVLLLVLLFVEFARRRSAEDRLKRVREERYKLCVLLVTAKFEASIPKRPATLTLEEHAEFKARCRAKAREFCRYKPPDVYLTYAMEDWRDHVVDGFLG